MGESRVGSRAEKLTIQNSTEEWENEERNISIRLPPIPFLRILIENGESPFLLSLLNHPVPLECVLLSSPFCFIPKLMEMNFSGFGFGTW